MIKVSKTLCLIAFMLLTAWNSQAAQEHREEQPAQQIPEEKKAAVSKISKEDREVIAHMKLLALMDMLKDMEILEGLEEKQ